MLEFSVSSLYHQANRNSISNHEETETEQTCNTKCWKPAKVEGCPDRYRHCNIITIFWHCHHKPLIFQGCLSVTNRITIILWQYCNIFTTNLSLQVLLVIFFADIRLWYLVMNLQRRVSYLHRQTCTQTDVNCSTFPELQTNCFSNAARSTTEITLLLLLLLLKLYSGAE